jgi:DNA-binding transcriptional MerR regulator
MEDMDSLKQFLSIQQVSQHLDVPKPTLRFWEKEFEGILVPLRTNGRQRRYAPEHVSVIEEIKMLKKAGLSLAEIKGKLEKGQKSEAGGQRSGDGRKEGIDLLAERVAEVVKIEILKFFRRVEV